MENRQNKPPKGGAASGHGGQKFHTDSEQAKLHKSKLRMESREERLNKARERLAKQKPPKKPGPIKRIARIAGHETHAFLHGKVYQEERDNVGVEGGHFVERSGEAALHYGRHKVRRAIREHPAKAAARAESRYIKATADYHSRKFAQEQPEAQSAAARTNRIGHRAVCPGSGGVRQAASRGDAACAGLSAGGADPAIVYVLDGVRGKQHPCGHRRQHL